MVPWSARGVIPSIAVIRAMTSHFASQAGVGACCLFEDIYEDGGILRFIPETPVPFSLHVRCLLSYLCSESRLSQRAFLGRRWLGGLGLYITGQVGGVGSVEGGASFLLQPPRFLGPWGLLITHCWHFGSDKVFCPCYCFGVRLQ